MGSKPKPRKAKKAKKGAIVVESPKRKPAKKKARATKSLIPKTVQDEINRMAMANAAFKASWGGIEVVEESSDKPLNSFDEEPTEEFVPVQLDLLD